MTKEDQTVHERKVTSCQFARCARFQLPVRNRDWQLGTGNWQLATGNSHVGVYRWFSICPWARSLELAGETDQRFLVAEAAKEV